MRWYHIDLLLNYWYRITNEDCISDYGVDACSHLQLMFCSRLKENWWAWKICANYLVNQNPRYIGRWGIGISRISDKAIGFISTERRSKSGSIKSTIWMQSLVWSRLRRWWLPTPGVIEIDASKAIAGFGKDWKGGLNPPFSFYIAKYFISL